MKSRKVYDRSQEWTEENRSFPTTSSDSSAAVQDAKEVKKLLSFLKSVFFQLRRIKLFRDGEILMFFIGCRCIKKQHDFHVINFPLFFLLFSFLSFVCFHYH